MSDPVYGTLKKKIVFYDSDKRYADLKIRLSHDGLSQAKFFRGILTGYLMQDPDILNFVDKLKAEKQKNSKQKKKIKKSRALINEGSETLDKLLLDQEEIESIFDILEKEDSSF
tara:strand:+ start:4959 stop:5300 length:342 start_codon:yes stop_codon:yes gene_type:complete